MTNQHGFGEVGRNEPQKLAMQGRRAAASLALACGLAGLALALHYPLAPWLAAGLFGTGVALLLARPHAWLIALPAVLPIVSFAPWTGWLIFEELDLLLLAVAAGGYARLALPPPRLADTERETAARGRGPAGGALARLVLALFAASVLLAMVRGVADAGGLDFGWFQSG